MIRVKDENSINNFYNKAESIFDSIVEEGEKNFFYPILKSKVYINGILKSLNKFSIDLAFPSLTLLSDIWYKNENVQIKIIHDDSKQVDFWKEFIMFLSKDISTEKRMLVSTREK
ncbi:MAG: hypothetical protein M0D53_12505 [Flavobacterium sp. JAD_PAG50586_2]|nr:MAG: hypothetical protein M0D53_12505 [Flavobacterium sp. JAD_PAG50586_2]